MAQTVRSVIDSDNTPVVVGGILVADSQTIAVGDLVQVNTSTRKLEAAVAASTTLVGYANAPITTGTATASDVLSITLLKAQVIRLAVDQTGTKKTFAQADMYTTAFDLKNKTAINPDDTTGGMCYVVGFDNTQNTVDVIFADASLAAIG
jgi:hypothetical protein